MGSLLLMCDKFNDSQYFRVAPELFSVTGNPKSTHWNLDTDYEDSLDAKSSMDFYPHRVVGTGYPNALGITLRLNPDDLDYMCRAPFQGFRLILHSPAEIPQQTKSFISVTLD